LPRPTPRLTSRCTLADWLVGLTVLLDTAEPNQVAALIGVAGAHMQYSVSRADGGASPGDEGLYGCPDGPQTLAPRAAGPHGPGDGAGDIPLGDYPGHGAPARHLAVNRLAHLGWEHLLGLIPVASLITSETETLNCSATETGAASGTSRSGGHDDVEAVEHDQARGQEAHAGDGLVRG
jgi:hypothetical protein